MHLLHPGAVAALVALLSTLLALPLAAQRSFCFRAPEAGRCGAFALTEFSFGPGTTTASRRPPFIGDWELGAMKRLGPRSALGGTIVFQYDESDRSLIGARPRYRRWISRHVALDFSAGVLTGFHDSAFDVTPTRVSIRAGIMWKDWLGFSAGLDRNRAGVDPYRRTETALLAGIRLGSYAGVAGWPLAAGFIRFMQRFGD